MHIPQAEALLFLGNISLKFFSSCFLSIRNCAFSLQLHLKHFVFKTCNISLSAPKQKQQTTSQFCLWQTDCIWMPRV